MIGLSGIYRAFLFALIFSVSANGVAIAASGLLHQQSCVQASADDASAAHDHVHHADGTEDAGLKHDHAACMAHACQAVSPDAPGAPGAPLTLSAALTAAERELVPLGLANGFLRPPKTS